MSGKRRRAHSIMPEKTAYSLTDLRESDQEEGDSRLYSLSLSNIEKHSELRSQHLKPTPFNIRWIHGYNPRVGVINLNDRGSTNAFYAASNCAVIYNWTTHQMKILQGHKHVVTCLSVDGQGKWLVTADSGPENIIIIWNSRDYFPERTIFSPHGIKNIAKIDLSGDAKYLLTMSYQDRSIDLHWWIWSHGHDQAHATLEVPIPRNGVIAMTFNPYNSEQFLLMTKYDIWIGISKKVFIVERGLVKETDDYELKIRKPQNKIHSDFGSLTCFTFVKKTSQILVATSRGGLLVYGYTIEHQENVDNDTLDYESLRFIKVFRIEKYRINVIRDVNSIIVTGNNVGEIRFYDDQMKLIYWVHGFQVDSVKGLSFNISPRSYQILDPKCNKPCLCWEKVIPVIDSETGMLKQKLMKKELPIDATTSGKPFIIRDFLICTNYQGVGFVDFVTEKLVTILDCTNSVVLTLSVHPEKPLLCLGFADGTVELNNFIQHKLFTRLKLRDHYKIVIPPKDDSIKCNYDIITPELSVTCLKYSPTGIHLACGLNTGQLIFLDPTTIDILTKTPFQDTAHAVKEINYSPDSLTMAMADEGKTICVYKYDCEKLTWTFLAKHRAHYKDISTVFFLPKKNADGEYKLVSLGTDRVMVEYDLGTSDEEYLEILSLDRVDQKAVPLAGIVWPIPKGLDPEQYCTELPAILIANNEYKYKIVNYETTMTLATVLGPRFENPVRRVELITRTENKEELQYLLFATKNIIGLQKLPLDGNPWKHVGLLGHPKEITGMCFRQDTGTLFTIGAADNCVCQWAANYRSVETTTKLGGGDLDPYYCLIENGRPGWLFQEIRDLFYYIQILCQGTFSPAMRRVKDYIPIDSLPDLMRALGFFPTEYEVENLIIEAKYKVYQRTPCTEIDFEEFVKLYLNHRPAFEESFRKIKEAFIAFGADEINDSYVIPRDDFLDMLTEFGECFPRELSWYLLSILSGHSFEDRLGMEENDFSFLPEELTFNDFVSDILGIENVDNLSENITFESVESILSLSDSD